MAATIVHTTDSEGQFDSTGTSLNVVATTTRPVVENSQHVFIDRQAIQEFSRTFDRRNMKWWLQAGPFDLSVLGDEEQMNFLLLVDSLSFRYWGDPKWRIHYQDKSYDGAWAMIASLKRALDRRIPILDAEYCANISIEDVKQIFAGDAVIPRLNDRWNIIRSTNRILLRRFGGRFSRIMQNSKHDALTLLQLITDNFVSFRDVSVVDGEQVFFLKKAQLLVADLDRAFSSGHFGQLKNIELITACADYKLPWVLRKLGILQYSRQLALRVDNSIPVMHNSREEIEIRANTIWAVEFIKNEINRVWPTVSTTMINDYLWLLAQAHSNGDLPYHLTDTVFY